MYPSLMTSTSVAVNRRLGSRKGNLRKPEALGKAENGISILAVLTPPYLRQEQVASHFLAGVVFEMCITELMQFRVVEELLPDITDSQET